MMSIQGIGQYGGLYQNYKMPSIPSVTLNEREDALQSTRTSEISQNSDAVDNSSTISNFDRNTDSVAIKNADLQDISLVFNKNDNFDYIGKDSEIGNLDVQKAVSDMKKDQILQEYQYFVGDIFSNENNGMEDGMVFLK